LFAGPLQFAHSLLKNTSKRVDRALDDAKLANALLSPPSWRVISALQTSVAVRLSKHLNPLPRSAPLSVLPDEIVFKDIHEAAMELNKGFLHFLQELSNEIPHDGLAPNLIEERSLLLDEICRGTTLASVALLSHSSLVLGERPTPLITRFRLAEVVSNAVSDAEGHALEKLGGTVPKVLPEGDLQAELIGIRSQLHFVILELLKNALVSTVQRHQRAGKDAPLELSPVHLRVSSSLAKSASPQDLTCGSNRNGAQLSANGSFPLEPGNLGGAVVVTVSDEGEGLRDPSAAGQWFFTTTEKHPPTYTYGGAFGSAISGFGMGLARSRCYLGAVGGTLRLNARSSSSLNTTAPVRTEQGGTDAEVHLPRRLPVHLAPE
jgi:hypothetical protein